MLKWLTSVLVIGLFVGALIYPTLRKNMISKEMPTAVPIKPDKKAPDSSADYLGKIQAAVAENQVVDTEILQAKIRQELDYMDEAGLQSGHSGVLYDLLAVQNEIADLKGDIKEKNRLQNNLIRLNSIAKKKSLKHGDEKAKKFIASVKRRLKDRQSGEVSVAHLYVYRSLEPLISNNDAARDILSSYIDSLVSVGQLNKALSEAKIWVDDVRPDQNYLLDARVKYLSLKTDDFQPSEQELLFAGLMNVQNDPRYKFLIASKSYAEKNFAQCEAELGPVVEEGGNIEPAIFYSIKDLLLKCYLETKSIDKIESLSTKHNLVKQSKKSASLRRSSELVFLIALNKREEAFKHCNETLVDAIDGRTYFLLHQLTICRSLYTAGFVWPENNQNLYTNNLKPFNNISLDSRRNKLMLSVLEKLMKDSKDDSSFLVKDLVQLMPKMDPLRWALEKYYP